MNNEKKSTIIPRITKIITTAFAISSAVTLAFFLFMKLYDPLGTDAYGLSFSSFICILIFSMIITCARLIFSVTSLNKIAAWIINYLIVAISFFVVFTTSKQIELDTSAEFFVAVFLFAFFYLLTVAIKLIIKKLLSPAKKDTEKKDYVKQF